MNENFANVEKKLRDEYCGTLSNMRFTEDAKASLVTRISTNATTGATRNTPSESESTTRDHKRYSRHVRELNEQSPLTRLFKSPASIAAAIAICLMIPISATAASGGLQGLFVDIKRQDGAIVGTKYEEATSEVRVTTSTEGSSLLVTATFEIPHVAPYAHTERLGISSYLILNSDGSKVAEGNAKPVTVENGSATILIPAENLESGTYKLIINSFVSEKKADQPLEIHGIWECEFFL